MEILGELLFGRTGRLYKGLVLSNEVATSVMAMQGCMKYAGMFYAVGETSAGHEPAQVESRIYAELERLQTEAVGDHELQKVKNNFAANEYRKLSSNLVLLQQLFMADGSRRWQEFNEAAEKHQQVTAADIQRVAKKYFTKETRTACTFFRKAAPPAAQGDGSAEVPPCSRACSTWLWPSSRPSPTLASSRKSPMSFAPNPRTPPPKTGRFLTIF